MFLSLFLLILGAVIPCSAQENMRIAGINLGWTSLEESSFGGNHLLLGFSADFQVQRHLGIRGQLGFGSPGTAEDDHSDRTEVRFLDAAAVWSTPRFWQELKGVYALTGIGIYNTHDSWALGGWSGSHTFGGGLAGLGLQWKAWEPALMRLEGQYRFSGGSEPDCWSVTFGLHLGI